MFPRGLQYGIPQVNPKHQESFLYDVDVSFTSNFSILINNTVGSTGLAINPVFRNFLFFVYTSVFIFGVTGNIAVIYTIVKTTKKLTVSEQLMTSLATADLLASFFSPIIMVYDLVLHNWYLGPVFCKVLPSLNIITLLASAWNLVIIAFDRHR